MPIVEDRAQPDHAELNVTCVPGLLLHQQQLNCFDDDKAGRDGIFDSNHGFDIGTQFRRTDQRDEGDRRSRRTDAYSTQIQAGLSQWCRTAR